MILFNGGRDSNVVTTNLIGWWKFNEGSGVVAGDSSGGGNDGSIQGATWIVG